MLVPCTSRARDGLRRRPRSTNHPMSGGDAEAPPGPAHLRAREVLATFASDPTYGDLVHDDFDAAAFSNAVIVRDRDGAPGGEGGESHAEATANRLLRRCQRALFALRRLREKVGALDRVEQAGGGVELRELGAAAALVGDVERLLDDGGEGRLRGLGVLAGEVGFVAATRDRLRATAERSLRVALDGGHLADAAAALGAPTSSGARDDAVAGAPRMLPPDADYLGAAAKDAPPRSVVALFEAQFLAER
ncbi:hypothetical protein SO694_00059125 [Aureococcus anophagefferens]|uniref:Uncharacterized protein n=1 Tax=Aureococcus anophagefferens TaxID=44056 RepID=A0ABR1FYN6_AURAN